MSALSIERIASSSGEDRRKTSPVRTFSANFVASSFVKPFSPKNPQSSLFSQHRGSVSVPYSNKDEVVLFELSSSRNCV